MNAVVNVLAYQLLWFGGVGGAAIGRDWLGPLLLALWLPVHLRLSGAVRRELAWVLALLLIGPLLDTLLVRGELIRFHGAAPWQAFAPYWIAGLWASFALTLNHSMRWIGQRPFSAMVFGALGGPLAYWAGGRLGAAELATPMWLSLLLIAALWTAVMAALSVAVRNTTTPVAA